MTNSFITALATIALLTVLSAIFIYLLHCGEHKPSIQSSQFNTSTVTISRITELSAKAGNLTITWRVNLSDKEEVQDSITLLGTIMAEIQATSSIQPDAGK